MGQFSASVNKELAISAVLVEQNLDLVMCAAQRWLVLDRGHIVHEGRVSHPEELALLENLLGV